MIVTDAGSAYDLRRVDQGEWEHLIREGLRKAAWKKAEGRRNDMQGIGGGVERDVTMALLSSDKMNDEQAGLLRCVLTGSIWTQDRLHRAGMARAANRCGTCMLRRTRNQNPRLLLFLLALTCNCLPVLLLSRA